MPTFRARKRHNFNRLRPFTLFSARLEQHSGFIMKKNERLTPNTPIGSKMISTNRVLLAFLLVLSFFEPACAQLTKPVEQVPFVPTPLEVVDRMLEFGAVKKGDIVYDLGSGDGRVVIRAAKQYGVKGVGIEMDSMLLRALAPRPSERASIIWQSFDERTLSKRIYRLLLSLRFTCCRRLMNSYGRCLRSN